MKKAIFLLSFIACISFAKAQNQEVKDLTIQFSYYYAFGTSPAASELSYWMGQPNYTLEQLVANHKKFLASNNEYKRTAIRRSYLYSFGRLPEGAESDYWAGQNKTFDELNKNHVGWLATAPQEWEKVILRAYVFIYDGGPTATEYQSWKSKKPIAWSDLCDILEKSKSTRAKSYSVQSTSGVSKPSVSRTTKYIGNKKVTIIQ